MRRLLFEIVMLCSYLLSFARNAIETFLYFYHAKVKQSKKSCDDIAITSHQMKEQSTMAGSSSKHKAFKAILQLVFEADKFLIEYLT